MRYLAALIVFLMFAAAVSPAAAGQHGHAHGGHGDHGDVFIGRGHMGHGPMGHAGRFYRPMPLGHILGRIRRAHPGRLSDVRGPWPGPHGEPHLRVKWLTPEGRVLWLDVDATTGEVTGVNGGRNRQDRDD